MASLDARLRKLEEQQAEAEAAADNEAVLVLPCNGREGGHPPGTVQILRVCGGKSTTEYIPPDQVVSHPLLGPGWAAKLPAARAMLADGAEGVTIRGNTVAEVGDDGRNPDLWPMPPGEPSDS